MNNENDIINVNSKLFFNKLNSMANTGKNMKKPLTDIGEIARKSILENFDLGGRYSKVGSVHGGSNRWEKLSDQGLESYAKRRNKGKSRNKINGKKSIKTMDISKII